ncbi:hypothetical protein QFZ31_005707 [Neobacillus niacini]|jgi:hypothetical protein|nr:hypothetical protein [Neobacillus niacini]
MEDKKDTKVAGYLPSPKSNQNSPKSSEYKEETATEIAVPVAITRPSFQEKSKNGSGAGKGTNAGTNSSEYKEETAAEIAAPVPITRPSFQERSKDSSGAGTGTKAGTGMGWAALALSILSLFVMPILFGAAGIVLGFVARRRGAESLGAWAIGIGAISIIVGIFILPFF